ncbi:hypothetical protein [Acinetobacter sp.]|uniref:hypothetical protein n=1 Tax=Acinetobacter sp. TaxID=472 RepID=UPI002648416C|nr:hypothetical protein [Acinetobacter sp.]MDN5513213.1 hypothetical protein [Acinetobacter sp.]MDN5525918.1 hypothetical protein [Acinetobacter sp.]
MPSSFFGPKIHAGYHRSTNSIPLKTCSNCPKASPCHSTIIKLLEYDGVNQDALFYDQKYSFNEKIVLKLEKPSPLLKKRHKSMENADFC